MLLLYFTNTHIVLPPNLGYFSYDQGGDISDDFTMGCSMFFFEVKLSALRIIKKRQLYKEEYLQRREGRFKLS